MIYKDLARFINERDYCIKNNHPYLKKFEETIEIYADNISSQIDYENECSINCESTPNKIIIDIEIFHNDSSCDYTIIITPSLINDININIKCKSYQDIFDLENELRDSFREILKKFYKKRSD